MEQQIAFDNYEIWYQQSDLVQQDDNFPFGLTFKSYSRRTVLRINTSIIRKEKQDELGLDWLDYGARMYTPEIGRWGVIDSLADERDWLTSYNYVQNNPLSRIDPDGRLDIIDIEKPQEKLLSLQQREMM